MRPFSLADKWRTDRYKTLEMFLQATKFGLLDLSWDTLCPECRGAKHTSHSLHDVTHDSFCPACNISYEVDFARTIEATFQVNTAIKAVVRDEFCMGSPQNTPHILMQQNIAPGESRTIKMLIAPGHYRWRVPKFAARGSEIPRITLNMTESADNGRVILEASTKTKNTETTLIMAESGLTSTNNVVGAGVATLTLTNTTNEAQFVMLEQTQWSDQATTAAEITSLQAFRDLFTGEVLRPGETINVERLAILFTDLKGSTALYTSVGDAPAFRRVMDHFSLLKEEVAKNHGALVKTIGDAIMAVFTDPVDAVKASLDILQRMETYNRENPDLPLILKMGIHQGTCIAVTLNERLDYFGTVVNLAARLEGQSLGHDVVVSNSIYTDPVVEDFITQAALQQEDFTTTIKGFSESFSLHRLTLPESTAVRA
jgi:class 3 adenylate cyclase